MNKEPLIILTAIGLVGYIVFHGHPLNQDCWLCPYRGLVFAGSSVALGTFIALHEN
jgi:hypothetical protein